VEDVRPVVADLFFKAVMKACKGSAESTRKGYANFARRAINLEYPAFKDMFITLSPNVVELVKDAKWNEEQKKASQGRVVGGLKKVLQDPVYSELVSHVNDVFFA